MSAVAGRRTYTEDELQAALRDIQSGKLGTRRAAVIYGIPRSTLRNKVYKLALERERESHLSTSSIKLDDEEMMDEDKELSGAEEEKEVEKALDGPLITMEDILRFSNIDNPEALKSLLLRSKEGQEAWTGLEHSSIGPYIQNLLFSPGNLLAAQKVAENDINPLLPEVIKRMIVQDQLLKEQQQKTHLNNGDNERLARPSPSNSVIMKTEKSKSESDMETEESSSNVILKIPSFKPTTSKNGCDLFRGVETSSIVSPPVTSDSSSPPILPGKGMTLKDVKDVIAQSISQKFQQSLEPARRPIMEMEYKRGGFTPPLGGISVIKSQQEINRPFQQQQQQQQQPQPPQPQQQKPQQSGSTQGGKGTRPKRGKYRNYDRDSLVEAVRAVQRGEMSVHRAGSYYGVPHSTLEYKVKERHLMRPRKRDPKPNPVDEKIASLKQNDLRNATTADKMKPVMKPPQKFPPTSPNGMKIPIFDPSIPPMPGYNPAPFPFWTPPGFHPHIPIDCGRNAAMPFPPNHPEFFAASQMMQKLQEESSRPPQSNSTTPTLAKSARQMAESLLDGSNTNGSFLDGIIRSSLESGVPGCEEKTSKEDKNVAPENMSNKALLDQLCRNSRLTPLSKPTETQNLTEKGSSPFNEDITRTGDSPQNTYDPSENSTIELSNDSNESNSRNNNRPAGTEEEQNSNRKATPPARIYLKQELTKPENLKPEMLVRFRDVLGDINGTGDSVTGSASESDAAQD